MDLLVALILGAMSNLRWAKSRSLRNDNKISQHTPRVRKIFVRNSGAGNGCANFMGAWKNALFLQEKPMSIKFLLLRGGGYFGFWGGGSADFISMGARIFLKNFSTIKFALSKFYCRCISHKKKNSVLDSFLFAP